MRFAWLRRMGALGNPTDPGWISRLILIVYNAVWWLPMVLPLIGVIDYGTGFWAVAAITAARLSANLYRNNILTPQQGAAFPFRSP